MKIRLSSGAVLALTILLAAQGAVAQKTSANVALRVSFRGSVLADDNPSGDKVLSDGKRYSAYGYADYVDGLDGVAAKLYADTTTDDFTLTLNQTNAKSPRYIYLRWDSVLYKDPDQPLPATDRFGGRVHVKYVYGFKSFSTDPVVICPAESLGCHQDGNGHWYMLTRGDVGNLQDGTGYTYVNRYQEVSFGTEHPCATTPFRVYHYEADSGSPERWVINTGLDATYQQNGYTCGGSVAGLTRKKSGASQMLLVGQFDMPFQMTLTRK
jgi:hypothetical protein